MPMSIRTAIDDLYNEECNALVVSMDMDCMPAVSVVPTSHRPRGQSEIPDLWDTVHLLLAERLGRTFAWSLAIQAGYLFDDVVPVKGHEFELSSRSSKNTFGLHTEDAFSNLAGNFLVLQCRLNTAQAGTMLASIPSSFLKTDLCRLLFDPVFEISVNPIHTDRISTHAGPILFGHPSQPYMRLNTNRPTSAPKAHLIALDALYDALQSNVVDVNLGPGQHLLLDNQRTAHGRGPFQTLDDATSQRWLRRLFVTSDIRKSRHLRNTPDSWIINI